MDKLISFFFGFSLDWLEKEMNLFMVLIFGMWFLKVSGPFHLKNSDDQSSSSCASTLHFKSGQGNYFNHVPFPQKLNQSIVQFLNYSWLQNRKVKATNLNYILFLLNRHCAFYIKCEFYIHYDCLWLMSHVMWSVWGLFSLWSELPWI